MNRIFYKYDFFKNLVLYIKKKISLKLPNKLPTG